MPGNRTLDLDELDREDYRRVLEEMDRLVGADPVSYLHPGKRWEYPWALERAALRPGARVLDVGAGDSIFPVYLARQGFRVTAVDLAFDGRLGEYHGVDIDYVKADMASMPLPSEAFDAVFCISVIEHLPDEGVVPALAELRRVLRPGSPLLLTTDYYDDADAEIWHRSDGREFRVDWRIFDEDRLRRLILDAPGWQLDGDLSLDVDWDAVKPRMRAYHGYPYTSVGIKLIRSDGAPASADAVDPAHAVEPADAAEELRGQLFTGLDRLAFALEMEAGEAVQAGDDEAAVRLEDQRLGVRLAQRLVSGVHADEVNHRIENTRAEYDSRTGGSGLAH